MSEYAFVAKFAFACFGEMYASVVVYEGALVVRFLALALRVHDTSLFGV